MFVCLSDYLIVCHEWMDGWSVYPLRGWFIDRSATHSPLGGGASFLCRPADWNLCVPCCRVFPLSACLSVSVCMCVPQCWLIHIQTYTHEGGLKVTTHEGGVSISCRPAICCPTDKCLWLTLICIQMYVCLSVCVCGNRTRTSVYSSLSLRVCVFVAFPGVTRLTMRLTRGGNPYVS